MVEAFARLLHEIRDQFGYRQEDLARLVGVDQTTVSDWETNRKNPSRQWVEEMTRYFPNYTPQVYVAARLLPLELEPGGRAAEAFARILLEIRERHQYRQGDLAEAIGANKGTVCEWETAKRIASRRYVEDLAEQFPDYRSRLYVAARILPTALETEQEQRLCTVLERTPAANMPGTIQDLL